MGTEVVVTPQWKRKSRHRRRLLLVVGAAVVMGATFFAGWHFGASGDQMLQARLDRLNHQLLDLRNENSQLLANNAKLSRKSQVEAESIRETQESLNVLVSEVSQLNRELEFYRRIIEPDKKIKKVAAKEFAVTPNAETGSYSYRLVLVQDVKNQRVVSGSVEVIYLKNDTSSNKNALVNRKFKFKYFQLIEGNFRLPKQFKSGQILLRIRSPSMSDGTVEEWFSWNGERVARR